ncbi:hypothetical protein P4161_26105 [Pseudomonas aeruginosa]|nr:hypothetical protein [Pseudomonas aeruginosa]
MTYQVSGLKNGDSAGQVLAGGLGRVGGEAVGQYDILQGACPHQRQLPAQLPGQPAEHPAAAGHAGRPGATGSALRLARTAEGARSGYPRGCGLPHHHAGKPVPRKPVPARLRSGYGRQRSEPAAGYRRGAGRGRQRQAGGAVHRSSAQGRGREWGGLLEPELPGRLLELLQQASEFLTLFAMRTIVSGR